MMTHQLQFRGTDTVGAWLRGMARAVEYIYRAKDCLSGNDVWILWHVSRSAWEKENKEEKKKIEG